MRVFIALTLLVALVSAVDPLTFKTGYPVKPAAHANTKAFPALAKTKNADVLAAANKLICGADKLKAATLVEVGVKTTNTPQLVGVKLGADQVEADCAKTKAISVSKDDNVAMVQIAMNSEMAADVTHTATDYEIVKTEKVFVFKVKGTDVTATTFLKDSHLVFACSKDANIATKANVIGFAGLIKEAPTASHPYVAVVPVTVAAGTTAAEIIATEVGCDKTNFKNVFIVSPGTGAVVGTKIGTVVEAATGKAATAATTEASPEDTEIAVLDMAAAQVADGDNQKKQFFFCAAAGVTKWDGKVPVFQAKWTKVTGETTKFKVEEFGGTAATKLSAMGCANSQTLYVTPSLEGTAVAVRLVKTPAADDDSGTATVATVAAVGMAAIAAAL